MRGNFPGLVGRLAPLGHSGPNRQRTYASRTRVCVAPGTTTGDAVDKTIRQAEREKDWERVTNLVRQAGHCKPGWEPTPCPHCEMVNLGTLIAQVHPDLVTTLVLYECKMLVFNGFGDGDEWRTVGCKGYFVRIYPTPPTPPRPMHMDCFFFAPDYDYCGNPDGCHCDGEW